MGKKNAAKNTDSVKKIFKTNMNETTSYLFKVARGLAFASSHLVEEEPCLDVSFDKQKYKKTNVRSFFSKRTIHSLTSSHSLTHHLITHFIF